MKQPKIFMETIEVTEVAEEKNNAMTFFTSLLCCLIAILIVAGSMGVYNHFKISKETKELRSLQNEASVIENDATNLRKRITEFNKKIDIVMDSKEKYPPNEPVPKKFDLSWKLEKEVP